MRKSNQIVQNFFYMINDNDILNCLYTLMLMINVPEHKKRLQEILDISNPGCSFDDFSEVVTQEVYYYENLPKEDSGYLADEITTENATNSIEDIPVNRCFIALYWSYNLKNENQDSILKVYNPRVGDVALKFLLYFLKMKQKETHMGCAEHLDGFYEDISARLVRIIDILPVMDAENSEYLQKIYFPDSKSDLALNFLKIQIENIWERNSLSVIKPTKTEKSTIGYKHIGENLQFIITPSRMTKKGALRGLDGTYNKLMKLYNLDLRNSSTNYSLGNKRKDSKKKIALAIEPLEEELIYENNSIDPEILTNEDQIEQLSKRKAYRRDMKDLSEQDGASEDTKEYIIPNAFQQHKHNVAFSSALAKQKLLLKSDYDIPILEHLKAFIASLDTYNKDRKIYTGFFILNVTLGCKIEDLLYLLQENEAGSLQLKNNSITVKVDSSLFAGNYNKLLSHSEDKLTFSIPIAMSALIVSLKKVFLEKAFNQVNFLEEYKEFIKFSVKQFPKSITINHKHLYRYLAQYVLLNGKDVLTSKFTTASYTQNDTAKLAYTSSRCNATEHSSLIKDYWSELCV